MEENVNNVQEEILRAIEETAKAIDAIKEEVEE